MQTSQGLRERRLGVLQGLTRAEAVVQQPAAWAALLSDPQGPGAAAHAATMRACGMEGEEEMQGRVVQAVQGVADQHPGGGT